MAKFPITLHTTYISGDFKQNLSCYYNNLHSTENRVVSAFGGNTDSNKCVFPSWDGEENIYGCQYNNYYWCPTTDNYARDHKWGYCNFKGLTAFN